MILRKLGLQRIRQELDKISLAIWRELYAESVSAVAEELEKVMFERAPLMEVIMDNGTVFRSEIFQTMM